MTLWEPGQSIVDPGVYARITNVGEALPAGVTQGVVGVLLRATRGPLNSAVRLTRLSDVDTIYGTGLGTEVAREALRGGALAVEAVRLGSGGTAASRTLVDGAAANVGTATAEDVGTGGNALYLTIRDTAASPTTLREALIYELISGAYTLRRTITFAKGGGDEMGALATAAALVPAGERWIEFTKTATGNGVLATLTLQGLTTTAGADPTMGATEYGTASLVLENEDWNLAVWDTNDVTIQATAKAWIDRLDSEGKRRFLVLGEPTSVALATRLTNSAAFNDRSVVYVLNGFTGSDGVTREGYTAAARVAGMKAGGGTRATLNRTPVANATAVVGPLTGGIGGQLTSAINAGAVAFATNTLGQVVTHKGVTTFVTPTAALDAGWKSLRRASIRNDLLNRINASWEPLIAQDFPNNEQGRSRFIGVGNGVIAQMVTEEALEAGGQVLLDPNRPPAGAEAYFIAAVDDLDGLAILKLTAEFRYAPPA